MVIADNIANLPTAQMSHGWICCLLPIHGKIGNYGFGPLLSDECLGRGVPLSIWEMTTMTRLCESPATARPARKEEQVREVWVRGTFLSRLLATLVETISHP